MDDKERRYYIDKLHDYANFQGIVRGICMCVEEGATNAMEGIEKLTEAEKNLTAKLLKLEKNYAEEG